MCQKCTYGNNTAGSDLLCERVATLVRCKDASTLRVMSEDSVCSLNCQDFFVSLDICLGLTTTQAKNIDIALAITLVKTG